jgi:hypothetical protein
MTGETTDGVFVDLDHRIFRIEEYVGHGGTKNNVRKYTCGSW